MNKLIMSIIFFSGVSFAQEKKLLKNKGFFSRKISVINPNNNKQHGGPIDHNKKAINGFRSQWSHKIFQLLHDNSSIFLAVPVVGSAFFLLVSGLSSSSNNGSSMDNWGNIPSGNSEVKHPKILGNGDGAKIDVNGIQNPSTVLNLEDQQFSWVNPSNPLNGKPENLGTAENPSTVLNLDNQQFSSAPKSNPSWVDLSNLLYANDKPISNHKDPDDLLSHIVMTKEKWNLLNSLKFFDNTITETYFKWAKDFDGSLKLLEKESFEKIVQTIIEDRIKLVRYVLSFWAHNQSKDVEDNKKLLEALQSFGGKRLYYSVKLYCSLINKAPFEQRQKFIDEIKIGPFIVENLTDLRDVFSPEEQKKVIDFKGLMELRPEEKALTTNLKTIPQLHTNKSKPNFVKIAIDFNKETNSLEIHRIVFQFCRADGDGFCLYNSFNKDADELNGTLQEMLKKPVDKFVKKKIIEPIDQFIMENEVYEHTNVENYTNRIVKSMDKEHNIFNEIKIIHDSKYELSDKNHILLAQMKEKIGDKDTDFLMDLNDCVQEIIKNHDTFSIKCCKSQKNYYKNEVFNSIFQEIDEEFKVQFPLVHYENPINAFYSNRLLDNLRKFEFKPSKDLKKKFVSAKEQLFNSYWDFLNGSWLELQKQLKDCDPIVKLFVDNINALKIVWNKVRNMDNLDFYKNFIKTMLDKSKKLYGNQHFLMGGYFLATDVYTNVVTDDNWNLNIRFDWSTIVELNREYLKKKLNKDEITDEELIKYIFVCKHRGIHFDRWQALKSQKFLIAITE
jgi:hypothetical protein